MSGLALTWPVRASSCATGRCAVTASPVMSGASALIQPSQPRARSSPARAWSSGRNATGWRSHARPSEMSAWRRGRPQTTRAAVAMTSTAARGAGASCPPRANAKALALSSPSPSAPPTAQPLVVPRPGATAPVTTRPHTSGGASTTSAAIPAARLLLATSVTSPAITATAIMTRRQYAGAIAPASTLTPIATAIVARNRASDSSRGGLPWLSRAILVNAGAALRATSTAESPSQPVATSPRDAAMSAGTGSIPRAVTSGLTPNSPLSRADTPLHQAP